ncbi:MAG: CDP-glycerol glycerophosphotransferase family protein, partial [Bacilli bacterium]
MSLFKPDDETAIYSIASKVAHSVDTLRLEAFSSVEQGFLLWVVRHGAKEEALRYIQHRMFETHLSNYIVEQSTLYHPIVTLFPQYKEQLIVPAPVVSRAENVSVRDKQLQIRGYAFVRGISSARQQTWIVAKNNTTKETKMWKCSPQTRTDLNHTFHLDDTDYALSGIVPMDIPFSDLCYTGNWTFFFRIMVDQKHTFETRIEIPLAEIKNKLKDISFKTNGDSYCGTFYYVEQRYLTLRVYNGRFIQKAKLWISRKRKDWTYNLSLLKRGKYRSFVALILYWIFQPFLRSQQLWLFGERRDTAQDNSFHLYKYMRTALFKRNCYYAIDRNSNDWSKVAEFGNVVHYGSLRHTLYLLVARFTINSYNEKYNMYTPEYWDIIKYYPEYAQNKKVFLQHGVIGMSRVNHALHKNKLDYDLFIVSSIAEKEHIVSEYGYRDEEVITTGLARWDALKDVSNQNHRCTNILLMPTWRKWIRSETDLLQSRYLQTMLRLMH